MKVDGEALASGSKGLAESGWSIPIWIAVVKGKAAQDNFMAPQEHKFWCPADAPMTPQPR